MKTYKIYLEGHLDLRWEVLFEGFSINHRLSVDKHPITVMIGPVVDQAALYGIIGRLRDLGLALISFQPNDPVETEYLDDAV